MKLAVILTLFVGFWSNCLADNFQLDGEPFLIPTNAQVVWGILVTNMPPELWVYKVYPQNFSQKVIENLLALSQLNTKNRVAKVNPQLLSMDTNFMEFQTLNERGRFLHRLDVIPALGNITYQNNSANYKDPLETAPKITKIEDLAFEDMFKAGIDRSLVETKPRNYSVSTTERGESPKETTNAIGIFYSRKIDGIDERGFCFSVNYGTLKGQPNLLALTVNWRNLVPYKVCSIVNTNDVIQLLKSGLTKAPQQPADLFLLDHAGRITITRFELIYFGDSPRQKVDFEYPYAELTVVANLDETNTATYYLNCPIIIDKNKP